MRIAGKYLFIYILFSFFVLKTHAQQIMPPNVKQKISEGILHLENAANYSDIVYAIRDFTDAVRLAPEFPDAHYYLAKSYSLLEGTKSIALTEYQNYLDLKINPPDSISVIKEINTIKTEKNYNTIDGISIEENERGLFVAIVNNFSQNFDKADVGDKLIKVENKSINDGFKYKKLLSLFDKNENNSISVSFKNKEGNVYNTVLNKAAAEEMIEYYNQTKIHLGRIGISYQLKDDTINITSVEKNSPSFKSGLSIGDKILSIDKIKVSAFQNDYNKISKKIRGEKGTKVSLEVLKKDSKKIINIDITREIVKIK